MKLRPSLCFSAIYTNYMLAMTILSIGGDLVGSGQVRKTVRMSGGGCTTVVTLIVRPKTSVVCIELGFGMPSDVCAEARARMQGGSRRTSPMIRPLRGIC